MKSTKSWIEYDYILDNGIIKTKNNYCRIIEVIPINFYFKAEAEKEIILELYKNLFQNVNFNFQIFIYSQKENLENYFINLNKNSQKENELKIEYINFLKSLVIKNKIYYKRFFIIISSDKILEDEACKDLDYKSITIVNNLKQTNNVFVLNKKSDILDILNYIYG